MPTEPIYTSITKRHERHLLQGLSPEASAERLQQEYDAEEWCLEEPRYRPPALTISAVGGALVVVGPEGPVDPGELWTRAPNIATPFTGMGRGIGRRDSGRGTRRSSRRSKGALSKAKD